ncbi:MAG: LysR substrate-binding domain-containing protein [Bacteroidia bacterium]|jgi:LysR family hydrogen peroxide-inducible transcriptional activator|nr:LysR substrate-binding domain-containing protein [Bacteroidia bacterium]
MNIQQFRYILAVAEFKHFETAAEKCYISQSTLSTMISKFEEEIGIRIFDRKKKPVNLTLEGSILLEQLKTISTDIEHLLEMAKQIKGEVSGKLNISVIPTVAPFLLPLFLQDFAQQFPNLNIVVKEETTEEILKKIKSREIDIGIVSIPLRDKAITEIPLYDEPFVYYDAQNKSKGKVSVNANISERMCLMEEGHCMRTQILELCDLNKKKNKSGLGFEYRAGSIDSLTRFVQSNKLTTLLPYLSTLGFTEETKKHLSNFKSPVPHRTVGLVVSRHFVKKKVLDQLKNKIVQKVSKLLPTTATQAHILRPTR